MEREEIGLNGTDVDEVSWKIKSKNCEHPAYNKSSINYHVNFVESQLVSWLYIVQWISMEKERRLSKFQVYLLISFEQTFSSQTFELKKK